MTISHMRLHKKIKWCRDRRQMERERGKKQKKQNETSYCFNSSLPCVRDAVWQKLWAHKPGWGRKFKSKAKEALIFDCTLSIIFVIYIMTQPLISRMRQALHASCVLMWTWTMSCCFPLVDQLLLLFSCKPRNLNQHMGAADNEVSVFPRSQQRVGSLQEVLQVYFKQTRLLNGFVLQGQAPGIMKRMIMTMSVMSPGLGIHRPSQNSCGASVFASAPWSSDGQKSHIPLYFFFNFI